MNRIETEETHELHRSIAAAVALVLILLALCWGVQAQALITPCTLATTGTLATTAITTGPVWYWPGPEPFIGPQMEPAQPAKRQHRARSVVKFMAPPHLCYNLTQPVDMFNIPGVRWRQCSEMPIPTTTTTMKDSFRVLPPDGHYDLDIGGTRYTVCQEGDELRIRKLR